jgi:hypothetical protein
MGVVIEICVKYPGGPTRITVTDMVMYFMVRRPLFNKHQVRILTPE